MRLTFTFYATNSLFQAHEALSDCAASSQAWAPAAKGDVEASIQHICPLWWEAVLIRTQNSWGGNSPDVERDFCVDTTLHYSISLLSKLIYLFKFLKILFLSKLNFNWIIFKSFEAFGLFFLFRSSHSKQKHSNTWPHNRVVVGRIMASQRCPHPNLWNQRITLHGQRDFIKCLERGECPGLSRWAGCITRVFRREGGSR